jgi:16S rRNA (uracil1498-N3)-methyltransferase
MGLGFPPPWFLAPPERWGVEDVRLPVEESRHAVKVLRLKVGDELTVFDGRGRVARARVSSLGEELTIRVLEVKTETPPRPRVIVYQGEAKGQKLDGVVERLAELGVAEVWTFSSERSVVRWDDLKKKRLVHRWESLARSAAKRSRHPHLLEPHVGLTWAQLLERIRAEPAAVTLWEDASFPLRAALPPPVERVAVIVGPEGGLTKAETECLADAGAPAVSLGPRIFRTENASIVTVSALLYHYGLIG